MSRGASSVNRGGICPERERLLRAVTAAVSEHSELVGRVHRIAGTGQSAAFKELASQVKESLQVVSRTWHAYEKHCKAHGC